MSYGSKRTMQYAQRSKLYYTIDGFMASTVITAFCMLHSADGLELL